MGIYDDGYPVIALGEYRIEVTEHPDHTETIRRIWSWEWPEGAALAWVSQTILADVQARYPCVVVSIDFSTRCHLLLRRDVGPMLLPIYQAWHKAGAYWRDNVKWRIIMTFQVWGLARWEDGARRDWTDIYLVAAARNAGRDMIFAAEGIGEWALGLVRGINNRYWAVIDWAADRLFGGLDQ